MSMARGKTKGGSFNSNEAESVSLEMSRMWRPIFEEFDPDHTGRISLDYLKAQVKAGNSHLQEIPTDILEAILERADWDNDRYLTFDEFLHFVHARDMLALRPRLHQLIRYSAIAVVPKNHRRTVTYSYIEHYNCRPPPIFILLISIIEIAVFVYYCVYMEEFSATGPIPFNSRLIYNPKRRHEAWRYITYAFVHAGFYHVFFNVLMQLILGVPLELIHKGWRVAIIYLGGVISGSMAASISDPLSYLAGASGGVYALISAHLANVIINWKEMEFAAARLFTLVVFAATDIGVAVYERYKERKNRVSYSAHIAGALAGLLIGVLTLRNLKKSRWEMILGYILVSIYIALVVGVILFNILNTDYFPETEYSVYDQI